MRATATPAPYVRSLIGCSTSPAPCWKMELCSTLHSRRQRKQLRDTQGHCAGDELRQPLSQSTVKMIGSSVVGRQARPKAAVGPWPAFTRPGSHDGQHSAAGIDE